MWHNEFTVMYSNLPKKELPAGWPRSLEIRENRENGQNKFPAGKNQGISKF